MCIYIYIHTYIHTYIHIYMYYVFHKYTQAYGYGSKPIESYQYPSVHIISKKV